MIAFYCMLVLDVLPNAYSLATQNMEEAEMFTQRPDDKAVVLRKGQVVVADNTPSLKARFGEGYR